MACSTVKRLTKPLDEPKIEFRRCRKASLRSYQNESLAIARRNLFDDEASSSYNTGAKPPTTLKTLNEHSHPNSSGFLNPIAFLTEQTGRIIDSRDIWLIQNVCTFQGLKNEDPLRYIRHYLSIVHNIQADGATRDTSRLRFFHFSLKGKAVEWPDRIPPTQVTTWDQLMSRFLYHFFPVERSPSWNTEIASEEGWNQIEEYVQYQDDLWDEPSPSMNISSISEAMQPTLKRRLKRACNRISFLKTPTREVGLKNLYLICDYCGGSHEADECEQNNPSKQVCLSGGDIYNDPSLLRFYQNDDTSPWGNSKRKEKGEDGPEWIIRSKFEDELANFKIEKKSHAKGIGDMLVQHCKELRKQYSQILSAINKSETPKPEAPTFTIKTRS
ncbi:DNA-directed DNA polymerase [Tanacetum coccineum]